MNNFHWRRFSVIALALLSAPSFARAELLLPSPTPTAKVVQQIGLTEVAIDYDCPAAKGRKVWGGIVPYDKPWTIATNAAVKVRFSRDVTVGDRAVPAGSYWMLATPAKGAWTIMLNKSPEPVVGLRDYKPELDVARVKVQTKSIARRERLAFSFSELTDDRASLDLEWDTLRVSIPVRVNTSEQILTEIRGLDDAWRSFANAARYMLEVKKDYDAGLKYIDESLALREDWYSLWIKGALLAGKGRFGEADAFAERAHALALEVGNGAALEPELMAAISTWRRRSRELGQSNSPSLAKIGTPGTSATVTPPATVSPTTPAKEPDGSSVAASDSSTSPPAFGPAVPTSAPTAASPSSSSSSTPAKVPSTPVGDPPLLRRARLRHR